MPGSVCKILWARNLKLCIPRITSAKLKCGVNNYTSKRP